MSRGLVLLDFYQYNDVAGFRDRYNFKGIEPFTLLIRNVREMATGLAESKFDELRWDGEQVHHTPLNPDLPGIWSSVTLYSDEVISQRNLWFKHWLDSHLKFTIRSAVNFHKTAGTGNTRNDILMNRDNEVRTVSITSILRDPLRYKYYYEDIINQQQHSKKIPLSGLA
jgi:hypothetical protein